MFNCPKCEKLTNYNFCKECNTMTNPTPTLPMENKSKEIKNLIMVGDDIPRQNHDNQKTHKYDLHNFSYHFNIIRTNPNFKDGKLIKMKGWSYRIIDTEKYTLHVKPNNVKIIIKERIKTTTPIETESNILTDITKFMLKWANDNGFKLSNTPVAENKEVKVIDCLVRENFRTSNFKSVYPIPSPVEFTNSERAVKDSVKFITHVDKIEDLLFRYTTQLDLHLQVEQKQLEVANKTIETLNAIKKQNERPTLSQRLKRWFK